jgi:hypothetical protein
MIESIHLRGGKNWKQCDDYEEEFEHSRLISFIMYGKYTSG